MHSEKISSLLAVSFIASLASLAATPSAKASLESPSAYRTSLRRMQHQLAAIPLLQPKGIYVGELQERWTFPSDHLPIAMTFDQFHFASWNVLDADFMNWVIEKNSQGLSRSMIADEHVYIGDSKLTIRDKHIADCIEEMISHPTHPRSLISLQECSLSFLTELRSRLPEHFTIVFHHGDAMLLDTRHFAIVESKEVAGIFKNEPKRTLQDITIRRLDNGQSIRLVNIHLPGNPLQPGRFEFAQYLKNTWDPSLTTIAMGDMNFNELEIADAMNQVFSSESPFSIYSPYCTNISPYEFKSKAIDHFLFYSQENASIALNDSSQVMTGLQAIVSMLGS